METSPPAAVLILAQHQPTARRWAAILEGAGFRAWLAVEDVPGGVAPDLLVTDREPAAPELTVLPEAGGVGVVRIGVSGPCDVLLLEDFTPRELCLACRLLAEVVRLRRRHQSGAEMSRRLAREALTDPLTGLPNRRAWDQALAERLAAASSRLGSLCVAILDLDHFKRVNDAHGHPAGDEVLRATGQAISENLRRDDFVARLGGDEFGLLLWVSDARSAAAVVDRVRQALPAALALAPTHIVTASAGYRVAKAGAAEQPSPLLRAGEGPGVRAAANQADQATPAGLPCPNELFAAADAALRLAKQQGRDRTLGG